MLWQLPNLRSLEIIDWDDFLPASAIPSGLTSLKLQEDRSLEEPDSFPSMPGLQELSVGYRIFADLIHLQPCPLSAATSLHTLQLSGSSHLNEKDVAALAVALPGLQQLYLRNYYLGISLDTERIMLHLKSLMPGLQFFYPSHNAHFGPNPFMCCGLHFALSAGFLSFLSNAAGAYGLLFLFFNFYMDPGQRFLVNVSLRIAALASMNFSLLPVGSAVAAIKAAAETADPLRPLWELLYIPLIPGISFTVFSWGVTLLAASGLLGWLAKRQ
ncbi:hypothetical protein C2E21_3296 [Chlorella sorokiniana]|uniref:Uncharacterized protein n=1 Tax=Chlorella sorokiniana TaxID=3076 RepID=A0A2P6TU39_CHLSO|nr:hypothetical protein C2E21_3296 [Chlorella sorokiniana]|eukprot:PRW57592.1 hypothetical protein C2E21_3296 [Chlorella sorokiniana]